MEYMEFADADGEQHLERQEAIIKLTEAFIKEYMRQNDHTMYLFEFGTMIHMLLIKMRQTMTYPQLGKYMIGLINVTEESLQSAKAEHGDAFILAEDWQDIPDGHELVRMLAELQRTDEADITVPD